MDFMDLMDLINLINLLDSIDGIDLVHLINFDRVGSNLIDYDILYCDIAIVHHEESTWLTRIEPRPAQSAESNPLQYTQVHPHPAASNLSCKAAAPTLTHLIQLPKNIGNLWQPVAASGSSQPNAECRLPGLAWVKLGFSLTGIAFGMVPGCGRGARGARESEQRVEVSFRALPFPRAPSPPPLALKPSYALPCLQRSQLLPNTPNSLPSCSPCAPSSASCSATWPRAAGQRRGVATPRSRPRRLVRRHQRRPQRPTLLRPQSRPRPGPASRLCVFAVTAAVADHRTSLKTAANRPPKPSTRRTLPRVRRLHRATSCQPSRIWRAATLS